MTFGEIVLLALVIMAIWIFAPVVLAAIIGVVYGAALLVQAGWNALFGK